MPIEWLYIDRHVRGAGDSPCVGLPTLCAAPVIVARWRFAGCARAVGKSSPSWRRDAPANSSPITPRADVRRLPAYAVPHAV
ncbi:hypothetical protein JR065_12610 [Xanthomonas sp. AmX2]|uniref:hypothetical protein n=1 Tax=Xanthomonas sp. TaxID=29446 RepID=UPI0019810E6D|nr:hypothetical protein [Xanthomonas sp.]MBN6151185.1 hypothetical protein [Xanthomonas sp.]